MVSFQNRLPFYHMNKFSCSANEICQLNNNISREMKFGNVTHISLKFCRLLCSNSCICRFSKESEYSGERKQRNIYE